MSKANIDSYWNEGYESITTHPFDFGYRGGYPSDFLTQDRDWGEEPPWIEYYRNSSTSREEVSFSDEDIAMEISKRIVNNPYIPPQDKEKVSVSVINGNVTLRGKVGKLKSKHLAHLSSLATFGVKDIVNKIAVEGIPARKLKLLK